MTTMLERRKATDKKIYNAAVIEFGNNGFANTTLSMIAKRAGITPGLIVQNFGSKEELYRRIALDTALKSREQLEPHSVTWEERCTAAVEMILDTLNRNPDFIHYLKFYVSLITSLDTPDSIVKELHEIYNGSSVNDIITEGQRKQEVIDGDPYIIHAMFWGNMHNTIRFCFEHKVDYPPTEWFLELIRRH